jgi:hypothetical protein
MTAVAGACQALDPNALQALLERKIATRVHYLLVDMKSGKAIAARWPDAGRAIAVGSLVKPFTAVAYGASTGFQFPRIECTGPPECWLAPGHGLIGAVEALAQSCNIYFLRLGDRLVAAPPPPVAGLPLPPGATSPETWAGLGDNWRMRPEAVLSGFRELVERRSQPGWNLVMEGLRTAAARGTARLLAAAAYAKTGTGPCGHGNSPGDGYTVAVFPPDAPTHILLVRAHGTTGARSAKIAGTILQTVRAGR